MNSERWKFAKSVFQAALELPDEDREACIRSRCCDPEMRDMLLKMLKGHSDGTDFLQSPLQANELRRGSDESGQAFSNRGTFESVVGKRFSDFEIVKQIGSGGMGTVFEAHQKHPNRSVAIKIINPGSGLTEKKLLRFEHEAEILARLQHPGICRVYTAGWHDFDSGRQPWFAMELIDGQPLCPTDALFANANSTQKIQLFLSICDAVEHAHGRGVIHRDLKPANILIVDAGKEALPLGQPKIVDFGVARVQDDSRRETLETATGDIMGTLNYMCPEQITADPSAIDERCDVYALGVIGYELLSGSLPHDRRGSSIAASLRMIEHDTPLQLAVANPEFRGDLEVIFSKALEKDPARRYRSVSSLAADLRRYLSHEPVLARPASTYYRCRKFISRHRTLVGGVLATFVSLIIGIALYANEAKQARISAAESQYEASKANAINNFMTNDFMMKLLAARNDRREDEPPPAFEIVHRAASNVHSMFVDQPTIEAAIRNEIGTIYYNLNAFESAEEQFRRALDLWQSALGDDHSDTLKAVNNIGLTYRCLGRTEKAEQYFRRALNGRIRILGESNPMTLVTMNNLANLLQTTDRSEEAESLLRQTLQLQQATIGREHKETLATMTNLGNLLRGAGDMESARSLHHQAWEISRHIVGGDHLMPLRIGNCYAQTLHHAGEYEQAVEVLLPNLDAFLQLVAPEHRDVITTRRLLARSYRESDELTKARAQLQAALDALLACEEPSQKLIRRLRRDMKRIDEQQPNKT